MNKEERKQYFENRLTQQGITEKGRRAMLEFWLKQKRSERWLNQKLDIEVLEEMVKEEQNGAQ